MHDIGLAEAAAPLVLAIDIGTSSARALLFDGTGRQVRNTEHQVVHRLATARDGAATADPDDLLQIVFSCIDHAVANAGHRQHDIAAVAMTTFWHSLMGVGPDMTPTTPLLMWSDTRSGADVRQLRTILDEQRIHTETGCRQHSSYWPAKLRWLQRTSPGAWAATATWVSFADYVSLALHGELATSISMASGTGLLQASGAAWHEEMVGLLGLSIDSLPRLTDRDVAFPPPLASFSARWPALADVPWFPALGDGATANVGAGSVGTSRVALTIGTSGAMRAIVEDDHDYESSTEPISPRLWQYRLDRRHRVHGGALSNGGNIAAWLAQLTSGASFTELSIEAGAVAPDGHGLTVLPFFAGERSPGWDDEATGCVSGLTLSTTRGELFRAFLESTAYRFAAIYDDLVARVTPEHQILANGAAALGSPLWLQTLADTLRHEVHALDAEAEASARGAAICVLESINAIDTLLSASHAVVRSYTPDTAAGQIYAEGRRRQRLLEELLATSRIVAPSLGGA